MNNTKFTECLKILGYTKSSFAEYLSVPYDTVLGWTKNGKETPAWVDVITALLFENKKMSLLLKAITPENSFEEKKSKFVKQFITNRTIPTEFKRAKALNYQIIDDKILVDPSNQEVKDILVVKNLKNIKFVRSSQWK